MGPEATAGDAASADALAGESAGVMLLNRSSSAVGVKASSEGYMTTADGRAHTRASLASCSGNPPTSRVARGCASSSSLPVAVVRSTSLL